MASFLYGVNRSIRVPVSRTDPAPISGIEHRLVPRAEPEH